MKWLALLVGLAALGVMVWAGRVEAQSTLGVPTIGTITVTTNTLTVPWTAPSDNGGAAISAYDLQYIRTDADEGVAANWTVVEAWTSGGGTLEYALTDLPDGVQFDVQVRAENAGGDIGDWSATVTGTTTDHSGTSSSATALTPGGSAIGRIEPKTDEDVFSIVLSSDAELWVYTTGPLEAVGELLDSSTVLKEADSGTIMDAPGGFEFRQKLEAGTYYVRVSSFEERAAGSYRIHVLTFTDPGDTFETATEVTLDSATPGRIGPVGGKPDDPDDPGDADYFKLVLTAATDIWVMAFGTNETEDEPLDSEGGLYGSDKSRLYWDDDSELVGNEEGFMFRRRLEAGTYYIRVNGYYGQDVGPYTLHVRTAAEPGGTAATATALTLRVPETGRISSRTDPDFFRLTIEADTYVFIYALTFEGALPLTPTILDDQGAEVSMHVIPHANWAEQGFGSLQLLGLGEARGGRLPHPHRPVRERDRGLPGSPFAVDIQPDTRAVHRHHDASERPLVRVPVAPQQYRTVRGRRRRGHQRRERLGGREPGLGRERCRSRQRAAVRPSRPQRQRCRHTEPPLLGQWQCPRPV